MSKYFCKYKTYNSVKSYFLYNSFNNILDNNKFEILFLLIEGKQKKCVNSE